jgi:hypothetical protein
VERAINAYFMELSQQLLWGTEKNHEKPVSITILQAENQNT